MCSLLAKHNRHHAIFAAPSAPRSKFGGYVFLIALSFMLFSVDATAGCVQNICTGGTWLSWNKMPAWTAQAAVFKNTPNPSVGLAVSEYPNPTFKPLGGESLKFLLANTASWQTFASGKLCQIATEAIVQKIQEGGDTARIDSCSANSEIDRVFVDKSNLSSTPIQMTGNPSFSAFPFTPGARIGLIIPNNVVVFTVTNIVTRPTIVLTFDVFIEATIDRGNLLTDPPILLSEFDATIPVGGIGSNNVLSITAQFNTDLLNTAIELSSKHFGASLGTIQKDAQDSFNEKIVYADDSPIKSGGYSKLESIAWSENLSEIFLMFTGGALTGNGIIKGSVWWSDNPKKNQATCEGVVVDAYVQAGFDKILISDAPKKKVGVLQSVNYRTSGTDSICDFVITGVPTESKIYVNPAIQQSAFDTKVTWNPFWSGPIEIPGGPCSLMVSGPGSTPGYQTETPDVCGSSASHVNFSIRPAPLDP